MSPKKPSSGLMRMDLRAPLAFAVAEGLLLLGIVALLSYRKVAFLPYVALGALILYLVSAGATLLAFILRYTGIKKAEEAAEQLNTDIYRMFRTAVDIPYAVINAGGSVRVINTAMQDILGLRSPVCNIPLTELCPGISPEQLAALAQDT